MRFSRLAWIGISAFVAAAASREAVRSCPFCSAPSLTLSEQVAQSDAVALVQWLEGEMPKDQEPGKTVYEIVQSVKAPAGTIKKSDRVTLARYRAGKSGDLFLLMGTRGV
jgi:hypothetical protein